MVRLSLLLLLVSCGGPKKTPVQAQVPERPASPDTPATPTPPGGTETLAEHMADHFSIVAKTQRAIIGGDLSTAKESAATLELLDPAEGLPDEWRPYVADMKKAAMETRDAATIDEAAAGLGRIGLACATCHEALGAGPKAEAQAYPEPDWAVDSIMPRHKWAADAMWMGLIAPTDDPFERGARVLTEAPMISKTEEWDHDVPEDFTKLEAQVRSIAAAAAADPDPDRKAELYGQFLATCAACHSAALAP